MGDIEPNYPEAARGQSGRVVLQLDIDEQGRVTRVEVVFAEPSGLFESSARAAFAAARFEPARRGGAPVRSQLTVEVDFNGGDQAGTLSPKTY